MTAAFNAGGVYYTVDLDTGRMLRQAPEVDRTLRSVEFRFGAVALAVQGLAGALALLKMARISDEMRLLGARVEVAAGSIERGAEAMAELQRISARTETALASNATVFNRLNPSIAQMGGNTRDTLSVVELLAKAIKVSGATAAEQTSAMVQFGQALGSGKLQGDELRSLLENAPYLMKQLADGIGVPVGALKQLGEEGKLTSDVIVNALTKAAARIDADFKKLPQTFDAAMTTLVDQLRRASEAGDTLTGTSAVLTGVAKGAAEAVGLLADQLGAAVTESDKLGRNDAIKGWADRTVELFSYVADAAHIAWQTVSVLGRNVAFVFETAGSRIGNLGAQAREVLNGNLRGAEELERQFGADSAARRQRLDEADARTLSGPLAGERMRQRIAALRNGTDGYIDRSDRLASGVKGSKLKSTGSSETSKRKRETEAEIKARQELARMARDDAAQLQADEEARDAAATAANVRSRQELARLAREDAAEQKADQDAKDAANSRAQGIQLAQGVIGENDEVARLQFNLQEKSALLAEYAEKDQENAELYAQARVALEQQTQARIAEIGAKRQQDQLAAQSQMLANYGALFGSLADMARTFEGEQSKTYKAMFVVSKAFAIADSIIKIQQGIANALSLPYPANITAAASTAAAAAGLVNTIKGTNFGGGRQYGGFSSAGTMYRINETGAPEMFVGSGGKQYMMPTTSGQVVPADKIGGAGGWTLIVNKLPANLDMAVEGVNNEQRIIQISVARSVAAVSQSFAEHQGSPWNSLASNSNVRARL